MATPSGMRIGDSDREAMAATLREHYAQGRLTLAEFQQRLNAVFAAKTDTDLARVNADLPHVSSYPQVWPPSGRTLPSGAGAGYSWQQGQSWQRGQSRQTGPSRGSAVFGFVLLMLAIAIIVSFFFPFALFGLVAIRPLLIVFAILAIIRRIIRRIFGIDIPIGRRKS
jgi:hypothetical protein